MRATISFFLINVKTKQVGMAMLFTTWKEIILPPIYIFAKFVIVPPFVWICV
jgi:hypothetical protein